MNIEPSIKETIENNDSKKLIKESIKFTQNTYDAYDNSKAINFSIQIDTLHTILNYEDKSTVSAIIKEMKEMNMSEQFKENLVEYAIWTQDPNVFKTCIQSFPNYILPAFINSRIDNQDPICNIHNALKLINKIDPENEIKNTALALYACGTINSPQFVVPILKNTKKSIPSIMTNIKKIFKKEYSKHKDAVTNNRLGITNSIIFELAKHYTGNSPTHRPKDIIPYDNPIEKYIVTNNELNTKKMISGIIKQIEIEKNPDNNIQANF